MQVYNEAKQLGISLADVDRIAGYPADAAEAYARNNGYPVFAAGGIHAGGWAMVGEQGPELAYMPPARIYSAQDTQQMMGGRNQDALIAELKGLRAEAQSNGAGITHLTAVLIDYAQRDLTHGEALVREWAGAASAVALARAQAQ